MSHVNVEDFIGLNVINQVDDNIDTTCSHRLTRNKYKPSIIMEMLNKIEMSDRTDNIVKF